jgi:hypothetical protein
MTENFTTVDKDELRRLQQNDKILDRIKESLCGRFSRRSKLNLIYKLNYIKTLTKKVLT